MEPTKRQKLEQEIEHCREQADLQLGRYDNRTAAEMWEERAMNLETELEGLQDE